MDGPRQKQLALTNVACCSNGISGIGCCVGRHVWNDLQSCPHPHSRYLKSDRSSFCTAQFILRSVSRPVEQNTCLDIYLFFYLVPRRYSSLSQCTGCDCDKLGKCVRVVWSVVDCWRSYILRLIINSVSWCLF